MLARGQNPDEVMQKIDEHWDALEQKQQQPVVEEESNKRPEKIDFSEIQRIINGLNKPDKKEKDDKKTKEDKKKFEKASPAEKSKMLRQELTSLLMQKIMDNSKKGKK
ncbi:hypothetical protein ACFFHF_00705 [Robertmurraya beringensis]|uniref:Uncharacterized protein n=1 Tax=Robertmurraya beringensis TaxID=641660 RepID=A0ABV6KKQ9_9BACI